MLIIKLPPHLHCHSCDPLMQQPVSSHLPVRKLIPLKIRVAGHFQNSLLSFFLETNVSGWQQLILVRHVQYVPLSTTQFDYQVSLIYVKIRPWLNSVVNTCWHIALWQTWKSWGYIFVLFSPIGLFQAALRFQLTTRSNATLQFVLFLVQLLSIWSNWATICHHHHHQNCNELLICKKSNIHLS